MKVAKYATDNDIPFGLNLSAPFLIQFNLPQVLQALEHASYVFGNEDESAAFGKSQGLPDGSTCAEVGKVIA